MVYCESTDVYRVSGIDSTVISAADVDLFITAAEAQVDRFTGTQWLFDSRSETEGTATSADATSLTDTGQSWTVDQFNDDYVIYIVSGTGSGQIRKITDNDATSVTVATWTNNPDNTSKYKIFLSSLITEVRDGTGTDTIFLDKHPLFQLESVTIDSTSVTTSKIYQYTNSAKLILKDTAEVSFWRASLPQMSTITYYYGVEPSTRIKSLIKDFCAVTAGMMALISQIGGTFDDVTAYTFPEFEVSKGEPFTNIRETINQLDKKMRVLLPLIPKYLQVV